MITPSSLKLIFKGRLEFGNQRTFDKVLQHWENRVEAYFKNDILFKPEQVFDPEAFHTYCSYRVEAWFRKTMAQHNCSFGGAVAICSSGLCRLLVS